MRATTSISRGDSSPAAKLMVLEATEFVRRFLMHVLPPRFVKIRYFGFLGTRGRKANIERARTLLGVTGESVTEERVRPAILCPACAAKKEHVTRPPVAPAIRPPPLIRHRA